MGKRLGALLVLLGLLLLLRHSALGMELRNLLEPYRYEIKEYFWGITFIAAGLYMITERALRKAVLTLYIIYLLLYLVV
ncbi:hypothetical protein A3L09_04930 [Thermococcus profundus]|uniref:Uncharacterized protein n=1 Tax=Thermococcus profundus TaxID=49899 RepID=A0A2Z2MB13_THEPR|nr:hypothetical protein [Thermococcus profundus]ASJ02649.1 hypothetical protein A3L09_04930 [Thermococcus profundus]